jgi:site-specific recombinase XerD
LLSAKFRAKIGEMPEIEANPAAPAVVRPYRPDSDTQLVQLWLHGRSPHTQRAYTADIRRFLSHSPKPLPSVTLADLQTFADSLLEPLADSSAYRVLSALKSLLSFGHRIGYLPVDVGRALRLPALRSRLSERILPEADIHRILSLETNPRNRAVLLFLYASGARVTEVSRLCWRDFRADGADGAHVTLFGKGGKTRAVKLPPSVAKSLAELRGGAGDTQPVFSSRKRGAALQPAGIFRIVRAAARRAGITDPVSPHWLRHAHASHALDRGAPIHLVQATLGHTSITTTGRYLHARPKESSSTFLGL